MKTTRNIAATNAASESRRGLPRVVLGVALWGGRRSNGVLIFYDDVGVLLHGVTPRITRSVEKAMVFPGREERVYADGAADYLARAEAVQSKGDAKGYVPKPTAPKAPRAPPATPPKAPSPPSAPDTKEPAPE